ncbi:hypothetical protein [Deinococcus sp. NW-56]|uniref:hypothetical protein n=1 Tax=Deinococcus sp. NW-56 TaxID=2080419 RepID=UPI00131A18B7|nr:hypothetical protein [Deinococcus sp. NW-56]
MSRVTVEEKIVSVLRSDTRLAGHDPDPGCDAEQGYHDRDDGQEEVAEQGNLYVFREFLVRQQLGASKGGSAIDCDQDGELGLSKFEPVIDGGQRGQQSLTPFRA